MESVLAARLRRPHGSLLEALIIQAKPSRRMALTALAAAVLFAGGFLLFRSSPFVAVEEVQITGVSGPDAAAISQALDVTAKGMSTLDYSAGALKASVSQYSIVRSLKVTTSFPHLMRIAVSEQQPVAALSANGLRTAVAADGVVLGPALLSRALPSIPVAVAPAVGRRISGAQLRSYLTVLGAAPAPLLGLISRVFIGQQGLTVQMRDGLLVYFGDASRPHAKWDSLVTVLTAPGSEGSSYVDVRLPERPAAGMPSGGVGSGESGQVSASDPTSAALAASLAKAVNGEPIVASPSASAAAGTSSSSASSPSQEPAATAQGAPATGVAGLSRHEPSQSESSSATAPSGQAEGG